MNQERPLFLIWREKIRKVSQRRERGYIDSRIVKTLVQPWRKRFEIFVHSPILVLRPWKLWRHNVGGERAEMNRRLT